MPDYSDLRPARRAKNITLTAVATQLGSGPPASENSADAETTNSPTATEPGSTPPNNA